MKEHEIIWELINVFSHFTKNTINIWLYDAGKKYDVSDAKYLILRELSMSPNISLKELARTQMVSAPSMSIMINLMVESKLVDRVTDEYDRRKVVLKLSDYGKEVYLKISEYIIEKLNEFITSLCDKDRKDLVDTSLHMIDIIKNVS